MVKTVIGYAAQAANNPLKPFKFERRDPGPHDVQIEILYCGICHTDIHIARNEWKDTIYPVVPGHEIVGRVTKVGSDVNRLKKGIWLRLDALLTLVVPAQIAKKG